MSPPDDGTVFTACEILHLSFVPEKATAAHTLPSPTMVRISIHEAVLAISADQVPKRLGPPWSEPE